jgi:hypothetical protein
MTRGGFGARSDVTLIPAPLGFDDPACRDRADLLPAWDMKDPGDTALPPDLAAMVAAARAVCSGCRSLIQCGDHALRHGEPMGLWGGLDPAQRRQLRRAAGLA